MSLEITFVTDAFMRAQNKRHMGKSGTTDVLSFPDQSVPEKDIGNPDLFAGQYLGDILISLDRAKKQALIQKVATRKEVLFLILHSILHLIGYDHANERERIQMQQLESQIWQKLQV